jgi:3-oxoacyl-[acyl-carrier-protein] synthase II
MSSLSHRAVLTGVGIVNPLGLDTAAFWAALQAGQSGIHPIQSFDASKLPSRIGGEVRGFDAKNYIAKQDRKTLRLMARGIQLAVAAAQLAMDDCKVDKSRLEPTRFGVDFGAGLLASELEELAPAATVSANCQPGLVDLEKWAEKGMANIPPTWMLKYLPNMLACHVSILHNAQGPSNTITEGEAGGLLALGEAFRILARGQADFFLVGGADSKINPLSMVKQCLFGPLSRNNEAPEKACRPFDRRRDGSVLGEGAGVLVLEELEHARRRGARIYAELVGFGAAFDRDHDGKGLARAIRAALQDAGIAPDQVDHVNANGLSAREADINEAQAIGEVFRESNAQVPVFAPKSYFGNLGAGCGTSELAASVLALHQGVLPASLNYEEPDPECPVNVIRRSQAVGRPYVVKTSFADMGQCAAVVLKKWEEGR